MTKQEKARVVVKVQPGASQNEALGFKDGCLRLRIAAPPTKGKANQELIEFLSHLLGVSKSTLTIERGMTSRTKVVGVNGLTHEQLIKRLEGLSK